MSANGRGGPIDASIWGISDTEFLAIVDDLADEDGWTSAIAVRLQLGENPEDDYHSGIGQRMAWQTRYGWLERHPDERLWRLTVEGHELLDGGGLSATFERSFARLNAAQRVQLTRELSQAGAGAGGPLRDALRREWQRNLLRRRQ